ncbi:MAG: hypothetical protein AAFV53_38850 [Myxococcota bacterium]
MSPLDSIQRHLDAGRWNEAVVEVRDHDAQRSRRTMRRRGLPDLLMDEVVQAATTEILAYPAIRRRKYPTADRLRTRFNQTLNNTTRRFNRVYWRGHISRSQQQPETPEEIVSAHEIMRHLLAEIQVKEDLKDAEASFYSLLWGNAASLAEELGVSESTSERRRADLRSWIKYELQKRLRIRWWEPGWSPLEPSVRPGPALFRGHRLELRLEQHDGALWARMHCAHARHLAVFAFVGGKMRCAGTLVQGEDEPLSEHRVRLPAKTERAVAVAVASLTPPDEAPEQHSDLLFWALVGDELWGRVQRGDTLYEIEASQLWEMAEAVALRVSPDLLQRTDDAIPSPGEKFGARLKKASKLGMAQRFAEAASIYREVWQQAVHEAEQGHEADQGAIVRSAIGAFTALQLLGFMEAAHRILVQLLTRVPLDARWTSWVIREMVSTHLDAEDAVGARRWLSQTSPDDYPSRAGNYYAQQATILFMEGRIEEADALIRDHVERLSEIRSGQKRVLYTDRFLARAREYAAGGGHVLDLIEEYDALEARYKGVHPVKRGARWVRAQVEAAAVMGHSGVGRGVVAEARLQMEHLGRSQLDRWQQRDLLIAAEQLSDLEARRDLIRLAYLHPSIAQDVDGYPLLAIAMGAGSLLWMSPGKEAQERAPAVATQIRAYILEALRELRRDICAQAVRRLGQLIFPEPLEGCVLVASDDLLTEAPLWAAHHAAHPDHPLPAFREVLGPRLDYSTTVRRGEIASLADPFDDLPGARAEVSPDQASVYLRGDDVTREALAAVEAGLVVLGTHAQLGRDGRYLEMADGPLFPDQLTAFDMGGAVVYLSGCATAVQSTIDGPELSFAHSLLQANAGGVVAFGLSVNDAAARQATEIMIDSWPRPNPAVWIRDAVQQMVQNKVPLHVVGGLRFY